jgi:hypothetical protein
MTLEEKIQRTLVQIDMEGIQTFPSYKMYFQKHLL